MRHRDCKGCKGGFHGTTRKTEAIYAFKSLSHRLQYSFCIQNNYCHYAACKIYWLYNSGDNFRLTVLQFRLTLFCNDLLLTLCYISAMENLCFGHGEYEDSLLRQKFIWLTKKGEPWATANSNLVLQYMQIIVSTRKTCPSWSLCHTKQAAADNDIIMDPAPTFDWSMGKPHDMMPPEMERGVSALSRFCTSSMTKGRSQKRTNKTALNETPITIERLRPQLRCVRI